MRSILTGTGQMESAKTSANLLVLDAATIRSQGIFNPEQRPGSNDISGEHIDRYSGRLALMWMF